MSTIVWVLTVVVSGMYAMPESVRLTFPTEQACRQAMGTVETHRKPYSVRCEPKAIPPTEKK